MNERLPFFTIVLPVYNVEKYMDRCVNSILQQDFNNYEIILVDDGSKDNCPKMCDEWTGKDQRISVIHKENTGLGLARNTGLHAAKGEYIFFIDSDDYILPGLLKDTFEAINTTHAEAVFYGFQRVDAQGNVRAVFTPDPPKLQYENRDEISNKLLPEFIAKNPHTGKSCNIRVSAWNCCLSVGFLKSSQLEFVSERIYISEDLYFYIQMFGQLSKVTFLKKMYYSYCQNSDSLTSRYRENRFEKLKIFYSAVESLANEQNYDGEVQLRLKASFIANVIGVLKMEAGNTQNAGYKKTYKNIVHICADSQLLDAIEKYPQTYFSKSWRLFIYFILKRKYRTLLLMLKIQYSRKGV